MINNFLSVFCERKKKKVLETDNETDETQRSRFAHCNCRGPQCCLARRPWPVVRHMNNEVGKNHECARGRPRSAHTSPPVTIGNVIDSFHLVPLREMWLFFVNGFFFTYTLSGGDGNIVILHCMTY